MPSWEEGEGRLGALVPLRADLLAGDSRLFYLLWLSAAEAGDLDDDEQEPLPGIGPLNGALEALADFFHIDSDLVRAAAERPAPVDAGTISTDALHEAIAAIPAGDKTALLRRLVDGDPHVAAEVRRMVRKAVMPATGEARERPRTVAELRARAAAVRNERETAAAQRREAERRRQAEIAARTRRVRLDALAQRGTASVWREIETEIERRNAPGYERAIGPAPRPPVAGRRERVVEGALGSRSIALRSARAKDTFHRAAGGAEGVLTPARTATRDN